MDNRQKVHVHLEICSIFFQNQWCEDMTEEGYNLEKASHDEFPYKENIYDDIQVKGTYRFEDNFKIYTNPLYDDTNRDDEMIYCHSVPDRDFYIFPNPLYEKEGCSHSVDKTKKENEFQEEGK